MQQCNFITIIFFSRYYKRQVPKSYMKNKRYIYVLISSITDTRPLHPNTNHNLKFVALSLVYMAVVHYFVISTLTYTRNINVLKHLNPPTLCIFSGLLVLKMIDVVIVRASTDYRFSRRRQCIDN